MSVANTTERPSFCSCRVRRRDKNVQYTTSLRFFFTSANSFWRARVSHDMTWMDEFLHSFDIQRDSVDWEKLYQTLQKIVVEKPSSPYVPGIRNRCRIWDLCSSLMDEYYFLKKRQDTESTQWPHILVGAYCCPIRSLRYPVDKRTITKMAALLGTMKIFLLVNPSYRRTGRPAASWQVSA